jgi:hypothetical protein
MRAHAAEQNNNNNGPTSCAKTTAPPSHCAAELSASGENLFFFVEAEGRGLLGELKTGEVLKTG